MTGAAGRRAGRPAGSAAARLVLVAALVASGCGVERREPAPADTTGATAGLPRCFVAERSVLAREPAGPVRGPAGVRGWIRLEGAPDADSGAALLVDADGASLGAAWRRVAADSVRLAAFDDFLRVEMRLALAGGGAAGTATAHSDAALERDSAGTLQDVRRSWPVQARRAPCDSMPAPRLPGPS